MTTNTNPPKLSADVVHLIFTFLPDFGTLHSTIRVSKAFYNVFEAHPQSIVRQIAFNQVGPALPQAIRLVRCESGEYNADVCLEEDMMTPPITPKEARRLAPNARVAQALEDLFSWRHKDITTPKSQLSSLESLRFQRALYRLWLFCFEFGWEQESFDYSPDDTQLFKIQQDRKNFLDVINTPELLQLELVTLFLNETSEWTALGEGLEAGSFSEWYAGWALCKGPEEVLLCYQECSTSSVLEDENFDFDFGEENVLVHGFCLGSLELIWEEREVDRPTANQFQSKVILEQVVGESAKCQHCDAVHGLKLWNETNWGLLRGIITVDNLKALFKGQLPNNPYEMAPFRQSLLDNTISYSQIMDGIFDLGLPIHSSKQDWLCLNCITQILRDHLHLWLLEHKRSAGNTIPEDCWYGCGCRTMIHKMSHATRLNHLCEQTRF